jgi:hypothetical protein
MKKCEKGDPLDFLTTPRTPWISNYCASMLKTEKETFLVFNQKKNLKTL